MFISLLNVNESVISAAFHKYFPRTAIQGEAHTSLDTYVHLVKLIFCIQGRIQLSTKKSMNQIRRTLLLAFLIKIYLQVITGHNLPGSHQKADKRPGLHEKFKPLARIQRKVEAAHHRYLQVID